MKFFETLKTILKLNKWLIRNAKRLQVGVFLHAIFNEAIHFSELVFLTAVS